MAQKSKAAAKPVRSEKQSGKKSKVKPAVKAVKTKAKPATVAAKPSAAKASAKVVAASKPAQPANGEAQIKAAKTALKKQSTAASDTSPRSEVKPKARKISIEISSNEAASSLAAKWSALYKKAEQIEAKPYNMRSQFEERTAINHKLLGWGYILTNRNDRLEVLFKDGIKYLISNYKG